MGIPFRAGCGIEEHDQESGELQSKLLQGGVYMQVFWGLLREILGVQSIAQIASQTD